MKSGILLFLWVLWCCGAGAQVQTGPVFVVTTLTDRDRTTAQTGDCSLREAIRAATASGRESSVIFDAGLKGTLRLNLGVLECSTPVSILGPGARDLTIAGSGSDRLFKVTGGPHRISGVTLSGGRIASNGEAGGGIWNAGTLLIEDCTLRDHQANAPARFESKGGAIHNAGTLKLERCTLSNNAANGGSAAGTGYDGLGGAIWNETGAMLVVEQSTFTGNMGKGGSGSPYGIGCGAIYNQGSAVIRNSTIVGNSGTSAPRGTEGARYAVGGIFSEGGICRVFSTILAGNSAVGFAAHRDVRGDFVSEGYNFVGAVTGFPENSNPVPAFGQPTDVSGTDGNPRDPGLGSLQNHGGPTDTMLPDEGSGVIDKGLRFGGAVDQRGLSRVVDDPDVPNAAGGDGSDVGAVERGGIALKGISFLDDVARVEIQGKAGYSYRFQWSEDLISPWMDFSGEVEVADGSGKLVIYDDFDGVERPPRRFYRAVRD